jgi:hypothetical protein
MAFLRQSGLFQVLIGIKTSTSLYWNSYLFVNDIPRLMETISHGHIFKTRASMLVDLFSSFGDRKRYVQPLGNKRGHAIFGRRLQRELWWNRAIYDFAVLFLSS